MLRESSPSVKIRSALRSPSAKWSRSEGQDRGVVERGRPQRVERHDVGHEPEPVVGELAPEADPVVELADHGDVALPQPVHEGGGRLLHVIQARPHAQGGVEKDQNRERRRLGRKEADLLGDSVLADHEIVGGQARDEAAAVVAHRHPQVDRLHLHLNAEGVLLCLADRRDRESPRDGREESCGHTSRHASPQAPGRSQSFPSITGILSRGGNPWWMDPVGGLPGPVLRSKEAPISAGCYNSRLESGAESPR